MEKVKEERCHLHARKKRDPEWCKLVRDRLGDEAENVCGDCLVFKRLREEKLCLN